MRTKLIGCFLTLFILLGASLAPASAQPAAVTYYVSNSSGNDAYNGLSQGAAFATMAKVNGLSLNQGDQVLLKCGDLWRVDPLVISRSGSASAPILFSSYPSGCSNKPILTGSRPISGWLLDSGSIYRADLPAKDFPLGINQLFRNGQRLTEGRWPNIDAPNGGYTFVTAHTANSATLTDSSLPTLDWTGAVIHIKNIRWSMLDRLVTSSNGHTLTLNQGLTCLIESWADCTGWGFFINNSKNTLDQDGEWFYDGLKKQVFMVSSSGTPANIEGSVVQTIGNNLPQGGIMLSNGSPTAYVVVDNLQVQNWFYDGISTPGSMFSDIYHNITVQNSIVKDVDAAGINLTSWLQNPPNGLQGLRGGNHLSFINNLIDGANDFGVTGFFSDSLFQGNTIQNIALITNLGTAGMGCGQTTGECTENGDGFRIRLFDARDSGSGNLLQSNIFDKIGYNGVDVFGPNTTMQNNYIHQSCYTKADCGGVRVFGDTSLAATTVYNIHLLANIINDIPGNVDGCPPSRAAFGMGLYIDNYSRDVESRGNTVINTTISGILYQESTGLITGNTIFNASSGTEFSGQIDLGGTDTSVTMSNNVMYGLKSSAWTLYASAFGNIQSSDQNYFFHPYVSQNIAYGPSWTRATFTQWQALSHQDAHSKPNWFTQPSGETSRGIILFNNTQALKAFDLGYRQYLTLDQKPVMGSLTLSPFTSMVLVDNGPAPITLLSITPGIAGKNSAAAFTLKVYGTGFTTSSLVRWAGSSRPTVFVSSTQLNASITPADVSVTGSYPVTVWDPAPNPNGTETSSIPFKVVDQVFGTYLPYSSH